MSSRAQQEFLHLVRTDGTIPAVRKKGADYSLLPFVGTSQVKVALPRSMPTDAMCM